MTPFDDMTPFAGVHSGSAHDHRQPSQTHGYAAGVLQCTTLCCGVLQHVAQGN